MTFYILDVLQPITVISWMHNLSCFRSVGYPSGWPLCPFDLDTFDFENFSAEEDVPGSLTISCLSPGVQPL